MYPKAMQDAKKRAVVGEVDGRQAGTGWSGRWSSISWLVLSAVVFVMQTGCAARRVPDGPPLQLHQGLGGIKFTYNNPAVQPVYHWFSLDTAFVSVLARQPGALEEARKATPFRAASTVANVGALVFTTKAMFTAFESADDFTRSKYESAQGDLAVSLGLGLAAMGLNLLANSHLQRSVSVFNVGEADSGGVLDGTGHWSLRAIRNASIRPAIGPGHGVRFIVGTRFELHP